MSKWGDSLIMNSAIYSTKQIAGWGELVDAYRERHWSGWAFRGLPNGSWALKPSLEREVTDRLGCEPARMLRVETDLLREFRRHYRRYGTSVPDEHDVMEWWSVMQHYGAPTRLLDFSYSVWIGAHFAIDDLDPSRTDTCAIWAFDSGWWASKAREVVPEIAEILKDDPNAKVPGNITQILRLEKPFVYPLNPFGLDERLAVQQGVFVVPGDLTRPFEANLKALDDCNEGHQHLVKFEIKASGELLKEAFQELRRMNIGNTSLFPGLAGFARDFRRRVALVE